MKHISIVILSSMLASLAACGGADDASDDSEGALSEPGSGAQSSGVELVVKATDSDASRAFLTSFVQGFRKIVDIDRRDGMSGTSSSQEIAEKIYKAKRNDGTIECEGLDECLFTLKPSGNGAGGVPLSKGDRNRWGGQIFSIFVEHTGSALGGNQPRNESVVIGKKGTVPWIECKQAGTERGLETAECSFNLR